MNDRLINALKTVAMARGTVIIDENLRGLGDELSGKNIRPRTPPAGLADDKIAEDWLPNRIFITNNSKDFTKHAPVYDIGIIATEKLGQIPMEDLAQVISEAITEFSLWSKRHGFILRLKTDGNHEFEPLTE